MLKDWQVQRNTQVMASIMSRLADVLSRHVRRGLYMLVKPRADVMPTASVAAERERERERKRERERWSE